MRKSLYEQYRSNSISSSNKSNRSIPSVCLWDRLIEKGSPKGYGWKIGIKTKFDFRSQSQVREEGRRRCDNQRNRSCIDLSQNQSQNVLSIKLGRKHFGNRQKVQFTIRENNEDGFGKQENRKFSQQFINQKEFGENKKLRMVLRENNYRSDKQRIYDVQDSQFDSVYKQEYLQKVGGGWKKKKVQMALPQSRVYKQFIQFKKQYDNAFQNQLYY